MSKIQKALQILQDGDADAAVRAKRRPGDGDVSRSRETPNGSAVRSQEHVEARGGRFMDPRHVDEQLPGISLEVSVESLVEQGIQARGADRELIEQQFRRIKRPVLNTAFGKGMHDSENANVIMVASALPRSGKTFCSFNLATSIAREKDVGAVLVDADVLKPNISRALGLQDHVGLIDYLVEDSISMDDILVATDFHGIVVVPAGRQHDDATELLASRRMTHFFGLLSERFSSRAIVVDTPPLLITNEAQVLAEHMGQIIMVIEAGQSDVESVTEALNTLNRSKPINAILNKARGRTFGDYGGYGYYSEP